VNVAAFFDMDGTLVPPPSLEKRFLRYLLWRGTIGWKSFARCAAPLLGETAHAIRGGEWCGFECVAAQCKAYLAGVPTVVMDAWLGWLARHPVDQIPEALQRIDWHARQAHKIFLLSGTLQPLAAAVARLIPTPVEICATQLEIENEHYTGRARGDAMCGPAKARELERLATEFSLDLERSYAYADSFADRWMLARVGHAAVVQTAASNSWRLARLARERGWTVMRWGAAAQRSENIKRGDPVFAARRKEPAAIIGAEVKSR